MAHTITIKYTALVAPNVAAVNPICRCFFPSNCAADNAAVAGTYYDTNVEGWGEGTKLDKFMQQVVAHPGLVAAIRKAVRDGEYTITDADEKTALYMEEVAPSLADQGFTITVDGGAQSEAAAEVTPEVTPEA